MIYNHLKVFFLSILMKYMKQYFFFFFFILLSFNFLNIHKKLLLNLQLHFISIYIICFDDIFLQLYNLI